MDKIGNWQTKKPAWRIFLFKNKFNYRAHRGKVLHNRVKYNYEKRDHQNEINKLAHVFTFLL